MTFRHAAEEICRKVMFFLIIFNLLTLKAKWFATLTKTMEIMMNNVVLMFSPTDEKTPYEEELVVARSIVHNFLKRSPAWTKPERVLMSLL